MQDQILIPSSSSPFQPILQLVLDAVDSPSTKRNYSRALNDFIAWFTSTGQPVLTKAVVQRYARELQDAGMGAANINQRLSAIRKLATEAGDNAILPQDIANGIQQVKGIRNEGQRLGNWMQKKQAQELLRMPDISTLKGKRDRALLAILIGAGLRRKEAASLTVEHIQQREGRWMIVDMVGKRNKTRSIPIPSWVKTALDEWVITAVITTGSILRPVNKGDRISGERMTDQAIYNTLQTYSPDLAPHDMRRTFAKLAHKGGAAIEQIQLSLGHSSVKTTERYLGVEQDLTDAPCDHLGLRL